MAKNCKILRNINDVDALFITINYCDSSCKIGTNGISIHHLQGAKDKTCLSFTSEQTKILWEALKLLELEEEKE